MLQAKLKVVGGRHHGKIIPLATRKFLIGREQDCHLRPNSELVSRHHCASGSTTSRSAFATWEAQTGPLSTTSESAASWCWERATIFASANSTLSCSLAISKRSEAIPLRFCPGQPTRPRPKRRPSPRPTLRLRSPCPSVPEDTGSSILAPESLTPVPTVPAGQGHNGDTTVVWNPQPAPGYGAEMYPPMGMPYQPPYQPAYNPYMPPGMGYQTPMGYPQMPMGYPGMYPQMGGYAAAPTYAPQQAQPAAIPEPAPSDEPVSMPTVRLPDPKTTAQSAATSSASRPGAGESRGNRHRPEPTLALRRTKAGDEPHRQTSRKRSRYSEKIHAAAAGLRGRAARHGQISAPPSGEISGPRNRLFLTGVEIHEQ